MRTKYRAIPLIGPKPKKEGEFDSFHISNPFSVGVRISAGSLPAYDRTFLDSRGPQMLKSEGHSEFMKPSERHYRGGDVGGEFESRKVYIRHVSHPKVTIGYEPGTPTTMWMDVAILPVDLPMRLNASGNAQLWFSQNPHKGSSDAMLRALGTTAIARCSPVNPNEALLVAMKELITDKLPTIIGSSFARRPSLRSAGEEHLNYQFGIKPLIQDVKKTYQSISHYDEMVRQLERDNGRLVRRHYAFPDEVSSSQTVQSNANLVTFVSPQAFASRTKQGVLVTDVKTIKKRWFSGAFTYYLPNSGHTDKFSKLMQGLEYTLGLNPDISDLWEATPYSWLADWAFNTGDVLRNMSNAAQFGLVMPYGYMMERTIVETTYTHTGAGFVNSNVRGPFVLRVIDDRRRRVEASPYGFGSTWDGFNSFQLGILAALGISRKRPQP